MHGSRLCFYDVCPATKTTAHYVQSLECKHPAARWLFFWTCFVCFFVCVCFVYICDCAIFLHPLNDRGLGAIVFVSAGTVGYITLCMCVRLRESVCGRGGCIPFLARGMHQLNNQACSEYLSSVALGRTFDVCLSVYLRAPSFRSERSVCFTQHTCRS